MEKYKKELRDMSMHELNIELDKQIKGIPKYAKFTPRGLQHYQGLIQAIKHEQTLRRKGLATQGVHVLNPSRNE